jgi:hypothetical protein
MVALKVVWMDYQMVVMLASQTAALKVVTMVDKRVVK